MSNIVVCDRCGDRIYDRLGGPHTTLNVAERHVGEYTLDLCESCAKAFRNFRTCRQTKKGTAS